MRRRPGPTAGQVLPFAVILIVAVLLPTFAFVGFGQVLLVRAGAQAAADAAALAGAQNETTTEQVDALGHVYSASVTIDTAAADAAAQSQWDADAGLLLGGGTTLFRVTVDNSPPVGAPPTLDVVAEVSIHVGLLALAGLGRVQTVQVQAIAGTCGATAWPGASGLGCSQGEVG